MTVTPFDRRILEEGDTASSNPAADHADQLQRVPILQGRIVDVELPGGQQAILTSHGLGRRFVGVLLLGASSTIRGPRFLTPESVDSDIPEGDSTINFHTIVTSPSFADDETIRVWVF